MTISVAYDHEIFCLQRYGGISRYFFEIASQLQRDSRFDVRIVAPFHFNSYLTTNPSFLIGLFVPPMPRTAKLRDFLNGKITKWGVKAIKPDIIHETYYRMDDYNYKRSKRVLTVHDMIHEKYPHYYLNDKTSEKKASAVKRADHVLCVSENTKKDLIEILKVPQKKITVVYHGTSFKPNSYAGSFSSRKSRRPYILYVGWRGHYKNFKRFLCAYSLASRLNNHFDLVCFGDKNISHKEKQLIRSMKLDNERIEFTNGEDKTLVDYYCGASAFIFPSIYEGFGIPLLEAMSCHCPIACSNIKCFKEIAGDAAEYFDPFNTDSIADAIQRIVYSSYRRKELIKLGNDRVKLFSWEKAAAKIGEIYHKIL